MSKVVVNQLQHSTGGSAPALTWFTADGTNNQHAYSTDTSGTLAWKTANPPPLQGNNVKMNFPNTVTSGKSFQTDGSGNLTLNQPQLLLVHQMQVNKVGDCVIELK